MTIASVPHLLSSELVHHITTNQENLNLQTLFGSSKYSAGINKRIIVASGVTIGATSTGNYALNIPSGFGGRILLVNQGSILGAGGAANSGTGGNAINAGASNIFIDNRGTISSGGGGGGQGGTGGAGYYTVSGTNNVYKGYSGVRYSSGPYYQLCQNACVQAFGGGSYCSVGCYLTPGQGGCGCPCWSIEAAGRGECNCCYRNESYSYNVSTSGGAGGNGGRGQGYDGAAASGSAGAAGGTNAGTGGTGGTGGSYGNSGNTGNTGANGNNGSGAAGTAGGLAGFYIVNNGNVTWVANGTRNGRIG